jgi:hypothetical protein
VETGPERVCMRDSLSPDRKRYLSRADIGDLWLERLVSQQCSTGNGDLYIPQVCGGAPGWFRSQELGLGWQHGPAITDAMTTIRADNLARRKELKRSEEGLVRAAIAHAKQKHIRTRIKPMDDLRGCTGCVWCVPDTRLRVRRAPSLERAWTWTPRDPNRAGRIVAAAAVRRQRDAEEAEWLAQKRRLTGGARDLRRLKAVAVRAVAKARRSEQRAMRAAVGRAIEATEGT